MVGEYKRINTATDYDTNGFEYCAQFDGVDDYLKSLLSGKKWLLNQQMKYHEKTIDYFKSIKLQ